MRWFTSLAVLFALSLALALPPNGSACPLCREAIADAAESDEDFTDFPAAMNQSIYMMLAGAYGSLGVFGFLIVRGARRNAAYRAALATPPPLAG